MTDVNSATNSAPTPAKFKKLVTLLKELFQLDQPDLDFALNLCDGLADRHRA